MIILLLVAVHLVEFCGCSGGRVVTLPSSLAPCLAVLSSLSAISILIHLQTEIIPLSPLKNRKVTSSVNFVTAD